MVDNSYGDNMFSKNSGFLKKQSDIVSLSNSNDFDDWINEVNQIFDEIENGKSEGEYKHLTKTDLEELCDIVKSYKDYNASEAASKLLYAMMKIQDRLFEEKFLLLQTKDILDSLNSLHFPHFGQKQIATKDGDASNVALSVLPYAIASGYIENLSKKTVIIAKLIGRDILNDYQEKSKTLDKGCLPFVDEKKNGIMAIMNVVRVNAKKLVAGKQLENCIYPETTMAYIYSLLKDDIKNPFKYLDFLKKKIKQNASDTYLNIIALYSADDLLEGQVAISEMECDIEDRVIYNPIKFSFDDNIIIIGLAEKLKSDGSYLDDFIKLLVENGLANDLNNVKIKDFELEYDLYNKKEKSYQYKLNYKDDKINDL